MRYLLIVAMALLCGSAWAADTKAVPAAPEAAKAAPAPALAPVPTIAEKSTAAPEAVAPVSVPAVKVDEKAAAAPGTAPAIPAKTSGGILAILKSTEAVIVQLTALLVAIAMLVKKIRDCGIREKALGVVTEKIEASKTDPKSQSSMAALCKTIADELPKAASAAGALLDAFAQKADAKVNTKA